MSNELRDGLSKAIDGALNRCECCDCSAEYEAAADAAIAYIRQHRSLKLAELVRALPHEVDCTARGLDVVFADSRLLGKSVGLDLALCNCPRGKLLAMLEKTA
jgi:hypothetical protein